MAFTVPRHSRPAVVVRGLVRRPGRAPAAVAEAGAGGALVERVLAHHVAQPRARVRVRVQRLDAVELGLGERGLGVEDVEGGGGAEAVVGLGHLEGLPGLGDVELGRAEDARRDPQAVDRLLRLEVDQGLEGDAVLADPGPVGPGLGDLARGAPAVEDRDLEGDARGSTSCSWARRSSRSRAPTSRRRR